MRAFLTVWTAII